MNRRLLLAVVAAALPAQALLAASASAQSAASARDNINALIEEQAKASGVPLSFVHQVVKRESNYNPNAKGGSALGLMQIKHATARGLGYRGDAAGLYDPKTNLRYGIAYLAGAYRTAKGDIRQAYTYYSRGYYYAAKRQGVIAEPAGLDDAPTLPAAPTSGSAFAEAFTRAAPRAGGANVIAANAALAYAATSLDAAPTDLVEVPLPPRRPASLIGGVIAAAPASPGAAPAAASADAPSATATDAAPIGVVDVPLPPRRPSAIRLAAVGRPIVANKPVAPGTVLEASAVAPNP